MEDLEPCCSIPHSGLFASRLYSSQKLQSESNSRELEPVSAMRRVQVMFQYRSLCLNLKALQHRDSDRFALMPDFPRAARALIEAAAFQDKHSMSRSSYRHSLLFLHTHRLCRCYHKRSVSPVLHGWLYARHLPGSCRMWTA